MLELEPKKKDRLYKAVLTLVVILCVYFGLRALNIMSGDGSNDVQNVITVTGHGEAKAVADIATIYFNVTASAATQDAAGTEVNTKVSEVLDFLKTSGVAEKDIKTENYSSYPKYSQSRPCPMYYSESMPPCEPTESKITGYNVSQSVTIKVRQLDDNLSKVVDGLNKLGVTSMSGPTLSIDNEDGLKADARREAIADAKDKAKALAKDLGVRLGSVTSFSENGGGYPVYYAKNTMAMDVAESAPAPEIPKGENTVSSDVTITYEIK